MRSRRPNDFTRDEQLREQQDRKDQQTKVVHEQVVADNDRDRQAQRKTKLELVLVVHALVVHATNARPAPPAR